MNVACENLTYYMRYRDVAKQRAREYYAKNKEKIKEMEEEKYKNLSNKTKEISFQSKKNGLINKLKKNKMK